MLRAIKSSGMTVKVGINVMTSCDIPEEEEVLEYAFNWKNHGDTHLG